MKSAVAIGLVALVAVALVVGAEARLDRGHHDTGSGPGSGPISAGSRPASAPFVGLTEVHVGVGSRCLRLAVAHTLAERVAGLRDKTALGRYDGMLFVFAAVTDAGFTMSGVTVPLDIGFYERDGTRDSSVRMEPCTKADADCPVYRAKDPFLYAIETPGGELPAGAVSACAST